VSTPPDARSPGQLALDRASVRPRRLAALRIPRALTREATEERFLSVRMVIGLGLYAAFALTFASFGVRGGDGLTYFNLLRAYVGDHPDWAFAYQFGSDVWNAPFFVLGKLAQEIYGQPRTFHVTFEELSITLATSIAYVVTLWLGWRILKELELPRGPAILLLTTFGTPLLHATIFDPAGKHAVDTLYITAAVYVFLRAASRCRTRDALVLGALAGVSINTRWGVNWAFFAVLAVAGIRAGRRRDVGIAAATTMAVGAVVFALPALRGIPYQIPKINPGPGTQYIAAPLGPLLASAPDADGIIFDPTIPFKMLFSEHRGLFLWTPLTALGVLGYALALRRARRSETHGGFYVTLLAAGLAILCVHMIWSKWDGGFSFSQRFLTALFPIFLIGVAELVRRWPVVVYPLLVVTAAWALALALVHHTGYDAVSERDGVGRVADAGYVNRHTIRIKIQDEAKDRWKYLWGLLHGYDTQHVNGP
jgi:hypothetical protein